MLLSLIRERGGVAAAVLTSLSVDLEQVGERIKASVRRGNAAIALGKLPYAARAKKVLEFAMTKLASSNTPMSERLRDFAVRSGYVRENA
jgi:hypothetical protein